MLENITHLFHAIKPMNTLHATMFLMILLDKNLQELDHRWKTQTKKGKVHLDCTWGLWVKRQKMKLLCPWRDLLFRSILSDLYPLLEVKAVQRDISRVLDSFRCPVADGVAKDEACKMAQNLNVTDSFHTMRHLFLKRLPQTNGFCVQAASSTTTAFLTIIELLKQSFIKQK